MSRVDIPKQDAAYNAWITNFVSVATANATLLNLTVGQTTTLNGLATAFSTAYDDSEGSKITTKSKVALKDSMREASEGQIRVTAKVINANPSISNSLKADLGITIAPAPAGPVGPPSDLLVVGYDNGVNKLSWSRNGNGEGTAFILEARIGTSVNWSYVGMTTKTKFSQMEMTPGEQVMYRVVAQRDDIQSAPSNVAIVYPIAEAETFSLSEAA